MSVKIPLYRLLKQIGIFLLVAFLVFRGTFVEDNSVGLNPVTGVNLVLSFILWGIINVHTYRLIPEYLFQGRYKAYIGFTISLVLCMLILLFIGVYVMGQYYPMTDNIKTLNSRFFFFLLLNTLALILYFFAFSFTIFLRRWVSYHHRLNELENSGLQTELNHLKEQLQPDFLSKMLNKTRTLSLEDADRASALIFKLSRLLRYQLYESAHKKVLLGDDMRFMTDYLELEKICNPAFNYEVRMESKVTYMQIPPLLFMPIIEYAIQNSIDAEKNIAVELRVEEEMLLFTCTYHLKESIWRKSLIVDDEPVARKGMKTLVEQIPQLVLTGSFNNALAASAFMNEHTVDLVFLDIQMPGITGLEFAQSIPKDTLVIFTTAYAEYALDSYDVGAIDYLVKLIEMNRFLKAVNKAVAYHKLLLPETLERVEEIQEEYIFIKSERRYFRINFGDILFIEGLKDYSILQLEDQRVVTKINLKNIHEQLPGRQFLRVNKSYIVNVSRIDSFDTNDIFIKSYEIAIGGSYKKLFFEEFVMKNLPKE